VDRNIRDDRLGDAIQAVGQEDSGKEGEKGGGAGEDLAKRCKSVGRGIARITRTALALIEKKLDSHLKKLPRLPFKEESYKIVPTKSSGVYVIFEKEDGTPCYAGTGLELRTRIKQHGKIYTVFSVNGTALMSNSSFRDYLLRVYFDKFVYSEGNRSYQKWVEATPGEELSSIYGRLTEKYEFSFFVCPEDQRNIIEMMVLAVLRPYINSGGRLCR